MNWIHPDKISDALKSAMEEYERYLVGRWPGARLDVHSDWREAPSTGVSVDQHVFGNAVDFHVEGVDPVSAWLALERFPRITGIGLYPYWRPVPGFHADVRKAAYRARWARDPEDKYVNLERDAMGVFVANSAVMPEGGVKRT